MVGSNGIEQDPGAPRSISLPDLEGWWGGFEAGLKSRGMILFPATPVSPQGAVEWPDDRSVEEFVAIAEELGVRLVYATPVYLNEAMIDQLGADDASQHIGRLAQVDIWWAYQGIRHFCTRLADWYLPLVEGTIERQRLEQEQQQANLTAQEQAIPEHAAALARNPAFGPARGGMPGRTQVAREMFPDMAAPIIRRVADQAWAIYVNEVAPEQERALAQRAQEMLRGGATLTEIARRLGVTRDRLGRALAAYEASGDESPSAPRLPL